jgi:hypothetical protein
VLIIGSGFLTHGLPFLRTATSTSSPISPTARRRSTMRTHGPSTSRRSSSRSARATSAASRSPPSSRATGWDSPSARSRSPDDSGSVEPAAAG